MTIDQTTTTNVCWPTNRATPPKGWQNLTDSDGTQPPMWFTRAAGNGFRDVVRGMPGRGRRGDLEPADARLRSRFEYVQRRYTFPDTGDHDGVATHTFTNLDFCGGWPSAITRLCGVDGDEAFLNRTLSGVKPASVLRVKEAAVEGCRQRAEDAGLSTVVYDHQQPETLNLLVAPARLDERADHDALLHHWRALAAADTARTRANWILQQAVEGLTAAFTTDLTAPAITCRSAHGPGTFEVLPWWDERTGRGLVMLGTILGYPPASTYALFCE